MKRTIIITLAVIVILALLFPLAEGYAQDAAQTKRPVPVIYEVQGRPVVCLSEPHEGLEQWRAMCAPMGPWMACMETEKTLSCVPGRPVGRWQ